MKIQWELLFLSSTQYMLDKLWFLLFLFTKNAQPRNVAGLGRDTGFLHWGPLGSGDNSLYVCTDGANIGEKLLPQKMGDGVLMTLNP